MIAEIDKLKKEVKEIKAEFSKLRNSLGINEDYEEGPQDISCNSIRIVSEEEVLVYIQTTGY